MHVALGVSFANREALASLPGIVERCAARLPGDIDGPPRIIRWDDGHAALLLWSNTRAIDDRATQTDRQGFAYTGYVTAQDPGPAALLERLDDRDGLPGFGESVGGNAAFFHIDRDSDTVVAWASRPMLQGLYYGAADGVSVVSTRPRIAAAALGVPARNSRYALAALAAGYPLGRETPFTSISAIESGEAAILRNGEVNLRRYPIPRVTSRGDDPFRDELLAATAAIGQQGENEFRLSGGKDSRLVAAAAYKLGLKITSHTRGKSKQWGEVRIAERVAAALGFEHRSGFDFAVGDLRSQMAKAMRGRDGVVYPEMFLSVVDSEAYPTSATSLTTGLSHLQRGGWVEASVRIGLPRPLAISCLQSRFVRPEVNEAQAPHVNQWFDNHRAQGLTIRGKLDSLFWCYENYRVSKYLQTMRLFYDPYLTCVFPLVDERFIRACGEMDQRDRKREIAVFTAIADFAPALARIPLFEDRYRFELAGPYEGLEDGYAERDPDSAKLSAGGIRAAAPLRRRRIFYTNTRNSAIIRETVLSSRLWADVKPHLTDETVLSIESLGESGTWWAPPEGIKRHAFVKFCWWLFAQAIAEEIEW